MSLFISRAEILARFEQETYSVNESDTNFEVCVIVEERPENISLTILAISRSNGSAKGIIVQYIFTRTICSYRLRINVAVHWLII